MEMPPETWKKEIIRLRRRVEQLPHQEDLHVFYGSSSIRLWVNMKDDLKPLNTLNLGFGGSSFDWCLHYFDTLFEGVHPQKLILYAGENDIGNGTEPERVVFNFERLFEKATREFPSTHISVISLKPSLKRTDLLPRIEDVNRMLFRFMKNQANGHFIEIYKEMLDNNGNVRRDLFLSDGLHMNKTGYAIWKNVIRDYFQLH